MSADSITDFTEDDITEMQRVISTAYEAWRVDEADMGRGIPWTRDVARAVLTFRPDLKGRWF